MTQSEELDIGSRDCTRFSELMERKWADDEPWSDADAAFYGAHSAHCAECRMFHELVHACEDAAETDFIPADGTVDLAVRRAVEQKFAPKNRGIWKPAVAAAAVAAGIVVAVFALSRNPAETDRKQPVFALSQGSIVIDGETVAVGETFTPTAKAPIISTDTLVEIPERLYVALEKDAQIDSIVRDEESDTLRISLRKGRMAVHLVPGDGLHLEIDTPGGRVAVTGTVFMVEARDREETVSVLRGTVKVTPKRERLASRSIKEGRAFSFSQNRELPRRHYADDSLLHLLGVPETLPPPPSPEEPRALSPDSSDTDAEPDHRSIAATRPSPELLLQAARACRTEKKWKCAVENYGKLVSLYPALPDAATAMIPMAQILLDNMNRPKEALQYFRRYRKKRPQGGLSQEALYGECRALGRLERLEAEQTCLEQYLEKYPNTLYTQMAKQRLMGIMSEE